MRNPRGTESPQAKGAVRTPGRACDSQFRSLHPSISWKSVPNRYYLSRPRRCVLKVGVAVAFLVAVPLVAGAWLLGTPDRTEGMVTMMMGVILAMFMLGVIFTTGPGSSGRSGPAPD